MTEADNTHPQTFIVTGRARLDDRVMLNPGAEYPVQHLPQLIDDWHPVYRVIGEGLEYLTCRICFPNGGKHEDYRRAPGS